MKAQRAAELSRLFLVQISLLAATTISAGSAEQSKAQDDSIRKFDGALKLFTEKKFNDSLALLGSYTERGNAEAKRLYYSALCMQKLGKESEAAKLFEQIRTQFPNSEAALHSTMYLSKTLGPNAARSTREGAALAVGATKNTFTSSPLRTHSISVPFRRTRKGQITVNATLNGRHMEMIFDTGAEECLFGRAQAELAGVHEQLQSVTLKTISGPVSAFYSIANIKLGDINKDVRVCVQDQNMEHAILGAPFMQGYTCTIDNRGGFLRLVPEEASDFKRIDSVSIPFEEDGAKIIVEAKINDHYRSMCFDTGAFGVCLSKKQADRLNIRVPDTSPTYIKGPNNNEVASWDVTANITLGPFSKRNCAVRIMDCEISYPLMGQNFFGDKLFTIDRRRREIQFAR